MSISVSLSELFETYKIALDDNDRTWAEYNRIDDLPELEARPWLRVQVGRLLQIGRNDDGSDKYEPIYAYSRDDIEKKYENHLRAQLSMFGNGLGCEEGRQRVRERYADLVFKKAAELEALYDQRRQMEDAAGLTAARTAAHATATRVKAIEAEIIAFVAMSLGDAAAIAAWVVEGMSDDTRGFLDESAPIEALKSLAKAVTS